jgi:hypothetical protein
MPFLLLSNKHFKHGSLKTAEGSDSASNQTSKHSLLLDFDISLSLFEITSLIPPAARLIHLKSFYIAQ